MASHRILALCLLVISLASSAEWHLGQPLLYPDPTTPRFLMATEVVVHGIATAATAGAIAAVDGQGAQAAGISMLDSLDLLPDERQVVIVVALTATQGAIVSVSSVYLRRESIEAIDQRLGSIAGYPPMRTPGSSPAGLAELPMPTAAGLVLSAGVTRTFAGVRHRLPSAAGVTTPALWALLVARLQPPTAADALRLMP